MFVWSMSFYYEHLTFLKFVGPPSATPLNFTPPSRTTARIILSVRTSVQDVRIDVGTGIRTYARTDAGMDVRTDVYTDVRTDIRTVLARVKCWALNLLDHPPQPCS